MSDEPADPAAGEPFRRSLAHRHPPQWEPGPIAALITLGLHVLGFFASLALGNLLGEDYLFAGFLMWLGVAQLVYMLPAIGIAKWRGKHDLAKGLMIAAAVTFLLNALCTGILFGVTHS